MAKAEISPKAGFIIRAAAAIVDGVIISLAVASLHIFGVLISWAYFIYLTYKWDGQTIGKKLFDIRVGDDQGKVPELSNIVIRETIGKLLSQLVFGLGYLWVIWDKSKQGWHDKLAKTYVYHTQPLSQGKKTLAWVLVILAIILPFILAFFFFGALMLFFRNSSPNTIKDLYQSNQMIPQNQASGTSLLQQN
ncbi:RDD family protein [Candidatus Daviesbacteria bacterium]|nr:RDD family protein [Candidatus Daviesbacteria bacterium]